MIKTSSHWKEVNFDNAPLEIIDGDRGKNYPKQTEFSDFGYCLFLNTGNVTSSGFDFSNCNFISKERDEALNKGRLQLKDVVLTTRGTVGNVAWFDENIPYQVIRINSGMVILRPELEKLLPEFLYFFIRSPEFQDQVIALRSGTAQPQLPIRNIKNIKIPLPPLEEQHRIAAILDKADAIRRKRKEAIRLTEELLRSTFLDMFGDPVTNPKGWEVKKLEDITTKITDGVHLRPKYTQTGVPFISVKDITTGKLRFEDCKFISEEEHKKYTKRYKPEFGDILYTKVGATYGRPALVDVHGEFSIYVSVCLLKPIKNLVRPQFLREVMATSALKQQADKAIKGIGVPDLHLNMIKKFLIPVPELKIQDEFLQKTEKIHKLQSASKLYLEQADNLFNSLLQSAFRGEL